MNRYWKKWRDRIVIAPEGRTYRRNIRELIFVADLVDAFGAQRLKIEAIVSPPDRRRRDLDNLEKCLWDSLEHSGLYRNDSQIDDKHMVRGDIDEEGVGKVWLFVEVLG